ncbi:MAG: sulfotransferase [Thiomargarita sp.]|nr:sulfotransferase [Thiomargarita sp.]
MSKSPYAPNLQTEILEIAKEWDGNIKKIDSFMISLSTTKAMTIKYEKLVSHPSKTMTEVCDWLGVLFEDNMLNFYKANKNKSLEPKLTMDWKKRTLNPISNETVGRYAQMLSKKEISEFEELTVETLKLHQYL